MRIVLRLLLASAVGFVTFESHQGNEVQAADRADSGFWKRAVKRRAPSNIPNGDSQNFVPAPTIFDSQGRRDRDGRASGTPLLARESAEPDFFTYKPKKRVTLRDRKLEGETSNNSYSQWIFDTLRDGANRRLRTGERSRAAIIAFYKRRKFEPVWIDGAGLNEKARRLLQTLSSAPEHGLTVSDYLPPQMKSFDAVPEGLFEDPEEAAALELGLTVVALRYALHASGGQVEPVKIGKSYDVKPPTVSHAFALGQMAYIDQPGEFLESLHPSHPLYAKLRAELNGTTNTARKKPGARIPRGRMLREGSENSRVPLIRARLAKLGFLESPASLTDEYFDEELEDAVKAFQRAKGLPRDGLVGRRTVRALNGGRSSKPRKKRRSKKFKQQLVLNMERMRWLPRELGARHIIVNQAAYQAQVIDNGNKTHQMRVIIGKPRHPTPIFSDEMETVVFNPYWYIPRSIIKTQHLPRSKGNPGYLDRRGFEVLNWKRERVPSRKVKWYKYNAENLPYILRQKPGNSNALGRIKFLFPNKHAVYMHDTPSRHLFRSNQRAYSHGCVRVQDPAKFAEVVLGWNADKVEAAIDARENKPVKLADKIPVHLTYFTLWLDDDGELETHDDVYSRDNALERALRAERTGKSRSKKRRRSKKFRLTNLD